MKTFEEINEDLLEQDYCRFIEKPKSHKLEINYDIISVLKSRLHGRIQEYLFGKLTALKKEHRYIPSAPIFDEIIQSYKFGRIDKEISIIQEKNQMIEIESCYYEKTKTKGLYSLSDTDIDMTSKLSYRCGKEFSIDEIRQYFKDNYGLKISENPTEKEQKRMFYAWADKINKTADKIIVKQDSTLLELDEIIKKVDSLDKKSR